MGQSKSSMPDISSTSDSDYEAKKSLEGDGQVANSERFHSRIIIFVDFLSVAGERPETFYSTIAVPAMKYANILELDQPLWTYAGAITLGVRNRAEPDSHL